MDLRSLKYFTTAAEEGTISAAALKCHIAQPSISNAIAQLEAEFDLKLFSRSKKGVALTPDGETFYQHAKSLLLNAIDFEQTFKLKQQLIPISVNISSQLASSDTAAILKRLHNQLPQFKFSAAENSSNAQLDICSLHEQKKKHHYIPLLNQKYVLLAPDTWSLTMPLQAEELLHYPWIDRLDCEKRSILLDRFPQLEDVSAIKVKHEDLAISLVKAGVGLTIMAIDQQSKPGIKRYSIDSLVGNKIDLVRTLGIQFSRSLPAKLREALCTLP